MVVTMFEPVMISPSILSADFMNMGRDVATIEDAGADWVHVDVMDGHFVPNLTMGVPLVKQLKKATSMPLDVHLMISNPLRQIPWFVEAGADIVTFHAEAVSEDEAFQAIETIHGMGAKAGVAIKPGTPASVVADLVPLVEMVLVMSVEPGFSGQSYIEGSEDKVAEVVQTAHDCGVAPTIQVDGGIGLGTLAKVVGKGADCLVCGNAVFAADSPASALSEIKELSSRVRDAALQGLGAL